MNGSKLKKKRNLKSLKGLFRFKFGKMWSNWSKTVQKLLVTRTSQKLPKQTQILNVPLSFRVHFSRATRVTQKVNQTKETVPTDTREAVEKVERWKTKVVLISL